MRFKLLTLALLTPLTACQTTPKDPMIWTRTDGQIITGNPILEQQAEIDKTICQGEQAKAAAGAPVIYNNGMGLAGAIDQGFRQDAQNKAVASVGQGCMATRGYVLVPTSQAAATAARFRANAAMAPKTVE